MTITEVMLIWMIATGFSGVATAAYWFIGEDARLRYLLARTNRVLRDDFLLDVVILNIQEMQSLRRALKQAKKHRVDEATLAQGWRHVANIRPLLTSLISIIQEYEEAGLDLEESKHTTYLELVNLLEQTNRLVKLLNDKSFNNTAINGRLRQGISKLKDYITSRQEEDERDNMHLN